MSETHLLRCRSWSLQQQQRRQASVPPTDAHSRAWGTCIILVYVLDSPIQRAEAQIRSCDFLWERRDGRSLPEGGRPSRARSMDPRVSVSHGGARSRPRIVWGRCALYNLPHARRNRWNGVSQSVAVRRSVDHLLTALCLGFTVTLGRPSDED